MESAFVKSSTQICVKEICQDLSMDFLLTDPFPEGFRKKHTYIAEDEPWEQYMLTRKLRSQYDYQLKRLCGDCTNLNCSFRKAVSPQIVASGAVPAPMKAKKDLFRHDLRQVCRQLSSKPGSKIKAGERKDTWKLQHAGPLYAYIGVALKDHLQMPQVPWKEMFDILHTDSDSSYLKGQASILGKAIKCKNYKALPSGYQDVNKAISKLSA